MDQNTLNYTYKKIMSAGKTFRQHYDDLTIPEPNSGCYLWLGRMYHTTGYGQVAWQGWCGGAHRWVYENTRGKIPSGLIVRHKCDNRLCVNPDHLEVGTQKDNINDQVVRGRRNDWKRGRKGERNYFAKLTEDQVRSIRRDTRPAIDVAAEYEITKAAVYFIRRRRTWKHVA